MVSTSIRKGKARISIGICRMCGKKHKQSNSKDRHLSTRNELEPCSYPNCDRTFKSKDCLNHHFLVHTEEKSNVCTTCDKAFRYKSGLELHLLTHSERRPYICSNCCRAFKLQSSLKTHQLIHGKKPYSCFKCNSYFSHKDILNDHLLVHRKEKTHVCYICDKAFWSRKNLMQHLLVHSVKKLYPCHNCGRDFSRKDYLNEHILTHCGEKPFACTECDKVFLRKQTLRKHVCVLSEEKPHVGRISNNDLRRKQHSEEHMFIQSGKKLNACPNSSKAFMDKAHLEEHLLVNSGEKLYVSHAVDNCSARDPGTENNSLHKLFPCFASACNTDRNGHIDQIPFISSENQSFPEVSTSLFDIPQQVSNVVVSCSPRNTKTEESSLLSILHDYAINTEPQWCIAYMPITSSDKSLYEHSTNLCVNPQQMCSVADSGWPKGPGIQKNSNPYNPLTSLLHIATAPRIGATYFTEQSSPVSPYDALLNEEFSNFSGNPQFSNFSANPQFSNINLQQMCSVADSGWPKGSRIQKNCSHPYNPPTSLPIDATAYRKGTTYCIEESSPVSPYDALWNEEFFNLSENPQFSNFFANSQISNVNPQQIFQDEVLVVRDKADVPNIKVGVSRIAMSEVWNEIGGIDLQNIPTHSVPVSHERTLEDIADGCLYESQPVLPQAVPSFDYFYDPLHFPTTNSAFYQEKVESDSFDQSKNYTQL